MEIFDRLKSLVGVGNATIEVADVAAPVRAGGELRATVVLRGGDYDVAVRDIALHLDEERMVYTAQGRGDFAFWHTRVQLTIPMQGRVLAKGEELRLPVALALPAELEVSEELRRYTLTAETEVPGLNPKHTVVVEVVA
jgi:sporulation-control protein spo0M